MRPRKLMRSKIRRTKPNHGSKPTLGKKRRPLKTGTKK